VVLAFPGKTPTLVGSTTLWVAVLAGHPSGPSSIPLARASFCTRRWRRLIQTQKTANMINDTAGTPPRRHARVIFYSKISQRKVVELINALTALLSTDEAACTHVAAHRTSRANCALSMMVRQEWLEWTSGFVGYLPHHNSTSNIGIAEVVRTRVQPRRFGLVEWIYRTTSQANGVTVYRKDVRVVTVNHKGFSEKEVFVRTVWSPSACGLASTWRVPCATMVLQVTWNSKLVPKRGVCSFGEASMTVESSLWIWSRKLGLETF
jgi:hypothetical protein